jgi:hypothetical protein
MHTASHIRVFGLRQSVALTPHTRQCHRAEIGIGAIVSSIELQDRCPLNEEFECIVHRLNTV